MVLNNSVFTDDAVAMLALDGGGIRGLSELLILHEVMRRIKYDLNLAELPRPCDYFDLIGGTSTGGLIALLLGRLQMSTEEALQTYNALAREIFSNKNRKWAHQDGFFKATTLEKKIQDIVSIRGLGEHIQDAHQQDSKGKAFVCAVAASDRQPRLFRTYAVRENPSANCKIWQAARATSAAPTIFKRIAIQEEDRPMEDFIDGALGYNNPTNLVLEEAKNVFGPRKVVRCIQTANSLSKRFRDFEDFYFRLNVEHGAEGISLDEWTRMGDLQGFTKTYLSEVSVTTTIDRLVKKLCQPVSPNQTLGSTLGEQNLVTDTLQDKKLFANKITEVLRQADNHVIKTTCKSERLTIKRLSGEQLPIHQCYINLGIIRQQRKDTGSDTESRPKASAFSLLERLKVIRPPKDFEIKLEALFETQEIQKGKTLKPRRILIQGNAGVGKTTLCKKIVYEFIHNKTWKDLFDRVFWVPLRNLKQRTQRGRYDIRELLHDEYFLNHSRGEEYARVLHNTYNNVVSNRNLFVLDGLDEIWHDLRDFDDMYRFVEDLLKQPNMIVTSRPSVNLARGPILFDLELETIGFYQDQVHQYIQAVEPKNTQDLRSFLDSHPLVRDLVRIPIQLDALCFTWQDVSEVAPQTMTDLYRSIEKGLWKKDILLLEKQNKGHPITEVQKLYPHEIEDLVLDETVILENLAFTGLFNNVIVFDYPFRSNVSRYLCPPGTGTEADLQKLSYLRPAASSVTNYNQTYYFLHLTLQEYFAAKHFVRKWRPNEMLKYFDLDAKEPAEITCSSLVQRYKYSSRYNIFWRFVSGLLGTENNNQTCRRRFFDCIRSEPLDLLGPAHQRLMMHCLNEIRPTEDFPYRNVLEINMSKWLSFECGNVMWRHYSSGASFRGESRLSSETEFPEQAVVRVLEKETEGIIVQILSSMNSRQRVPYNVFEVLSAWLHEFMSIRMEVSLLHLLAAIQEQLTDTVVIQVSTRLEHENKDIRRAAIKVLGGRSDLLEQTLNQIAARLKDEDWHVRRAAVEILRGRSDLPEQTLNQIAARLKDEIWDVQWAAVEVLGGRSDLPEQTLNQIAARLKDEDWGVRRAAIEVLGGRSDLPEQTINQIAAQIEDQELLTHLSNENILKVILLPKVSLDFHDRDRIQLLLLCLLSRGFDSHLAWYIQNGHHCLEDDTGCIFLRGQHDLLDVISQEWERVSKPPIDV